MSIKDWFGGRAAKDRLPDSPLLPLAERVQKQAEDLHETTITLQRLIADREAKGGYEPTTSQ